MKADLLREKFLTFFKAKKHRIVEPDSLAPKNDPTVLFTPAGMNQFKKEFLGFDSGFSRAATVQRCLRTDDLDKVGKTCGHHTFFEMLGNFSFGDYFKKEAISFAWEFLTKVLGIDSQRLWVSVYKDDDEAYLIWKETIKVPERKIIKLGDKENFWPSEAKTKGPNGPCGPCSEIFFDLGADVGCKEEICDPSCDCGRFLEVWNLVFTQFNRKENQALEPLPRKNIDTGMGLERLAAVMQGVVNNFQTDLFQPIIKEVTAGIEDPVKAKQEKALVYAISDHIRAIVFAIYDGVMPANEARGYVVRKLIRKSALHLRTLGFKQPFLYKLVPVLSQIMQRFYPELKERRENIAEIILAEEKSFYATLDSSVALFKEKFKDCVGREDPEKAGRIAFQLYDTYGIPLELTVGWLKKNNINISQAAFEKELSEQKIRSKLQSTMKGDVFDNKSIDYTVKESKFLGYKDSLVKAKILKIIQNQSQVKKVTKGDSAAIILEKTVFYPESGGQVGDTGKLIRGKNIFTVEGTQKIGNAILHIGKVQEGAFKEQDLLTAEIDLPRRLAVARSHTATHLLQAALRKVLGAHVRQQGSLVAPDRLRFDFTHFKNIDRAQLERIEAQVNDSILGNYKVMTKQSSLKEAKKSGALAFFAEKYASKVRIVTVADISKELCGGTHLDYTGQIGVFKILQEGSAASGIRRIEALTGTAAHRLIEERERIILELTDFLNVPADKIKQELEKKSAQLKSLEKQLNSKRIDSLKENLNGLVQEAEAINGIKFISRVVENLDMDLLRKNVDLIKEKTTGAIIALGSKNDNRAILVVGITEDLCQKGWDAAKLVHDLAGLIGGSGGGRKDFAQAGGNKPESLILLIEELKKKVSANEDNPANQ